MFDAAIFGILNNLRGTFYARVDCDLVDRLNYYYSGLIFILLAIMSIARTYVGVAISCWCPAEFTGSMVQYTENFCWISDTYWVREGEQAPKEHSDRDKLKVRYYQWVPFVFMLFALLAYLPAMLWRLMGWRSGIDLSTLSQLGQGADTLSADGRKKTTEMIARHLSSVFDMQRARRHASDACTAAAARQCSRCFILCWCFDCLGTRHHGTYLTGCYLTTKLFYLLNVPLILELLKRFFGYADFFQGAEMLNRLLNGTDWAQTGHFPRITHCDVKIRAFGTDRAATVQCVLPINIIYEKIYVFVWCWFIVLFFVNVANLLLWIVRVFAPMSRIKFVKKYLKLGGREMYPGKSAERKGMEKFVRSHLGFDGVLVLRLFSMNAGFVLTYEVLRILWTDYRRRLEAASGDPVEGTEPVNGPESKDQTPHRRKGLFPNIFGRGSRNSEHMV